MNNVVVKLSAKDASMISEDAIGYNIDISAVLDKLRESLVKENIKPVKYDTSIEVLNRGTILVIYLTIFAEEDIDVRSRFIISSIDDTLEYSTSKSGFIFSDFKLSSNQVDDDKLRKIEEMVGQPLVSLKKIKHD